MNDATKTEENFVDKGQIIKWFSSQACDEKDAASMARWREGIAAVAADFVDTTPMSGDVIIALRSLKAAMMAMNAALVSPMPK